MTDKVKNKIDKANGAELGVVTAANDLGAVTSITLSNNAAVNSTSGHGIMAEEAMTVIDKIMGRTAEVVGRTNEKNGADRLVCGEYYQTKFYNSGKASIDACFEDNKDGGMYRYLNDDLSPMKVEVPKDMYGEAVERFREKIINEKVPGITDPNDAENYVKAGSITYDDARALCHPLTKQSILYDMVLGLRFSALAGLLCLCLTFFFVLKKTKDKILSLKSALKSALKAFSISYICSCTLAQFSRSGWYKTLYKTIEKLVPSSSNKVAEISNAMSLAVGDTVYSVSAAVRRFSKILSMSLVINIVSLCLFIVWDIALLVLRKISSYEFLKRLIEKICTRILATVMVMSVSVIFAGLFGFFGWILVVMCYAASYLAAIFINGFVDRIFKNAKHEEIVA